MAGQPKATPQRWVKVAVDYYRNPKVIVSGPFAELAYVRLLALARERVEYSDVDGAVPLVLAQRELRDIGDILPDGETTDTLLATLQANGLVTLDGDSVVVDDYAKWQTTRGEIEADRSSARARSAARRAAVE